MVTKIKLMAEYFSSGVWWYEHPENVGPISLDELPLSEETRNRISAWIELFTSFLDWDQPNDPIYEPPLEDVKKFLKEKKALWLKLREELGSDYEVVCDCHGKTLDHPEQLQELISELGLSHLYD